MLTSMKKKEAKDLSLGWALFCLGFLLVIMILSVSKVIEVPIHVTLLASMALTIAVVSLAGNRSWDEISEYLAYGGKLCIQPTIIMMVVGCLIGSWIASGTVPMVIYWGLKMINPSIFLVTSCLVCGITALASGSSWSAAGTVGIALMGIGGGLGIDPALTAGSIISGVYFGDKMSPMSDTTNLAAAVAEADLFDHIRSMTYTTAPAFIITLLVYGVFGFRYAATGVDTESVTILLNTLDETFRLSPFTLIPPLVVIVMAVKQYPAIPTLLMAVLSAFLVAVFVQGFPIAAVASALDTGFVSETGISDVDRLLTRGGLQGMLWTASLGMLGMLYGAILEKSGLLAVFLSSLKRFTKSLSGLVIVTIAALFGLQAATASQSLTIVVGGRMFIDVYKEKDLLPQAFSRTLEDGGTLSSPLIPWSLCGVYMAGTLDVSTLAYAPYAMFCWLCPLIAILYSFTGKFFWKTGEKSSKKTYRLDRGIS